MTSEVGENVNRVRDYEDDRVFVEWFHRRKDRLQDREVSGEKGQSVLAYKFSASTLSMQAVTLKPDETAGHARKHTKTYPSFALHQR